jgi:hypothetical protein
LRRAYGDSAFDLVPLSRLLALPIETLRQMLRAPFFGEAWDAVEAAAPALRRSPVPVADLPVQMEVAEAIVASLRPATERSQDDRGDLSGSQTLEPEGLD